MKRALILLHRYLGIAVGIVMATWCVSGVVMMYVSYPSLDNSHRLRALEPINWQGCCAFDALATAIGNHPIDGFNIEMVAGRPVLRVVRPRGDRSNIDLLSGKRIERFTQAEAEATATRYLATLGENGALKYREMNAPDQWTIGSRLSRERGLQVVSLGDAHATELYLSSKNGEVVLNTNAHQRFWNWFGPVTHWLYPTLLRQNVALWSQVVIWLALLGTFLTVVGLYLGISQWRAMSRSRDDRWSPYRGVNLWHHLSGLIFGVLTLTWVFSGFLSMNPWGLLESTGVRGEQARLGSLAFDGTQLPGVLQNIVSASHSAADIVRLETAPLNGKLFLLKFSKDDLEHPVRVAALTLESASLSLHDVEQAANELTPGVAVKQIDLLTQGDAYYSHNDARSLPVYRVILDDKERTRYYLDTTSAAIIDKVDANRRWYRWLFEAPHRWDFFDRLQRPWWDVIVLSLLLGVAAVSFTGVYMAYRRVTPKRGLDTYG